MKLLAKTAEERYQTAASVEANLRHCLTEWESHRRIEPFALGDRDVSDRLLIPEKLYGREREIDTLLACFDRIVTHLFEVANQLNRGAAADRSRRESAGGRDRSACRTKGQGVGGVRLGVRVPGGRHGDARPSGLGQPI
jgi:hypothetical protein